MSRMRPFGFSGDLKDLAPVSPFLPAGLGLVRPESGFFPSLATSPFLHPALDSRLPSLASGPFRCQYLSIGNIVTPLYPGQCSR